MSYKALRILVLENSILNSSKHQFSPCHPVLKPCPTSCTKSLAHLAEAQFIVARRQGECSTFNVQIQTMYPNSNFAIRFLDYSTIFNGNVVSAAKAVVCPLDAEDVSK
jgi:hypothetical protein